MTGKEFREIRKVRPCEKCCATCKHGRDLCDDGLYQCVHPDMAICGDYIYTDGTDVCDVWEGCSS
jgi:hypothetical protein